LLIIHFSIAKTDASIVAVPAASAATNSVVTIHIFYNRCSSPWRFYEDFRFAATQY
jgi:hypothetical protein